MKKLSFINILMKKVSYVWQSSCDEKKWIRVRFFLFATLVNWDIYECFHTQLSMESWEVRKSVINFIQCWLHDFQLWYRCYVSNNELEFHVRIQFHPSFSQLDSFGHTKRDPFISDGRKEKFNQRNYGGEGSEWNSLVTAKWSRLVRESSDMKFKTCLEFEKLTTFTMMNQAGSAARLKALIQNMKLFVKLWHFLDEFFRTFCCCCWW